MRRARLVAVRSRGLIRIRRAGTARARLRYRNGRYFLALAAQRLSRARFYAVPGGVLVRVFSAVRARTRRGLAVR